MHSKRQSQEHEERQGRLGFSEAEGSFQERLNLVNLALQRIEADIYLCRLLERVFYLTHGGVEGETVVKTHEELAARPLWLCCSRSKARCTVGLARHHGLLTVEENRYATGGQKANGYAIDWEGIRAILHGGRGGSQGRPRRSDRPAASGLSGEDRQGLPGASSGHPPALIDHPRASTEQGGASLEAPLKKNLSSIFSESSSPVPVPGRATAKPGDREKLPEALAIVPELAEASRRPVTGRPVGKLVYGVFAVLQERHLGQAATLVAWYRMQLSLPDPVLTGAVEAEAILVTAAGLYALRLPARDVRKSRVGVFVHTVTRRDWRRVLRYVPEAAEAVREVLREPCTTEAAT